MKYRDLSFPDIGAVSVLQAIVSQADGGRLVGYGRYPEEAIIHAGGSCYSGDTVQFEERDVLNNPGEDDSESEVICLEICKFHAIEDEYIPPEVGRYLAGLVIEKRYADAIQFCFDYCWDRAFEDGGD